MSIVEDFFSNVEGACRFAYLEEDSTDTYAPSFSYEELSNVVSRVEDISEDDLYLQRGVLCCGTPRYLSAELGSFKEGVTYVFFNSINEDSTFTTVLARIVETSLDSPMESTDSTIDNNLKCNQVVANNSFVEAEYIALNINGVWYRFNDIVNGKNLRRDLLDIEKELKPIS